jgi:hypothetical protein
MGMESNDQWSLKQVQPEESSEQWFFRKNLAPVVSPADPKYPFIAFLTFSYSPRDESGLPSNHDEEVFFRIEDEEIACLEVNGLSVQVASVLKSGIKDMLFYTRDPEEFLRIAERFRNQYPQYQVSCEIGEDPKWEQYEDFP